MPYGKTSAEWAALPQSERTALAGGSGSGTARERENTRLAAAGQSSGGRGVGGITGSTRQGILSSGAASQQGGGVGVPLGSIGGGTTGAGRPPIPGYQPPSQQTTMQTQQNPYLKQLMELSVGQFNTPVDRNAERAATRAEQSLAMNEARQSAGARGGQGMWGAQQQAMSQAQQRALAGQEAGFGTRETEARRALLGTMGGIAGTGVQDIESQLRSQQAAADLQERSRQADMNYQQRAQEIANQGYSTRLASLSTLLNLI